MVSSQPQTNGVSSSSTAGPSQANSQPTQTTAASSGSTTVPNTQATAATASSANQPPQQQPSTSSPVPPHVPRPRDSRMMELLLTSQGVTSYDQRVPLLLLDFAYRHMSAVMSDALHLSTDPYVSQAGARPSGSSGAVPSAPAAGDASVSVGAVHLAIASRQAFQFRGGAGGGHNGGGGASKDWLQELARDRNRTALPRILANEWGVRLPNERFVLSGRSWGLKDSWDAAADDDDDEDGYSDDEEMVDIVEGPKKDAPAAGAEEGGGGGLDELLEDDVGDEDMEME
ncbi:transcription initiation factor IID, 31kD subunit-domain-containing protein [Hypoxylon sp. FL1284]|nr:transcription initiation factor IID, 31kD subunit-domain-containing protein [Hypoxylon sp. FL1284]